VHAVVQGAHLDQAVDQSAQRRGEGGYADVPVVRVGEHEDIGGQPVAMLVEDGRQRRRAGLLLALDEDGDTHRRLAVVREIGSHVGRDSGLVVGGSPAVQPAAALGGLERRTVPVALVPRRLHVVVGVQQHGGRPRGRWVPGHDRRPPARLDHLDVREAHRPQQTCHRLGAAGHLRCVAVDVAHGRDADQVLEPAVDPWPVPFDGGPELGHPGRRGRVGAGHGTRP
jgi:hypothetical protein